MTISELISPLPQAVLSGAADTPITSITADSREVGEGCAFIATPGETVDGASFIEQAIEAGAAAIIAENAPNVGYTGPAWVHVGNAREAAGLIASQFHGSPSQQMKVAGVTGTNGKTTTSYLLHHVMKAAWRRAGLLGTLVMDDGLEQVEATHTTPTSLVIQAAMGRMLDNGCKGGAMEVSSHGIAQKRIAGVDFDVAIFTNLTQDHLDFHGTMEAYFEAKKTLFTGMIDPSAKRKKAAVINIDDLHGEKLATELKDDLFIMTYGYSVHADFRATKVQGQASSTSFELVHKDKRYLVKMPLVGRFNVSNALAVIAAASTLGIRPREAVKALASAPQVPGRVEFVDTIGGASVVVDYAHTPDALSNICRTIRELEPNRLFTLFGCGGDRDAAKRPLMARAASALSDFVILTSDNPRSEDPEKILRQTERGIDGCSYEVIVDRREAIQAAINSLRKGDVLVIAGKGHEDYQEVNGEKLAFDDRKIAREAIAERTTNTVIEARIKDKEWAKKRALRERQEGNRDDDDRRPYRDWKGDDS